MQECRKLALLSYNLKSKDLKMNLYRLWDLNSQKREIYESISK